MTTSTALKARREALGISREALTAFCPRGTMSNVIRDQERPKHIYVARWHIKAVEAAEAWFADHAEAVEAEILRLAHEGDIEGMPVLWHYADRSFSSCSMHGQCLGLVDLYQACLLNVRADLGEAGAQIIDAEFLPDKFAQFWKTLGPADDTPQNRAKWWRHWSKQYVMED